MKEIEIAEDTSISLFGKNLSTILDFWKWSYSDLKEPTNRGDFAEYLVYLAIKGELSKEHYSTRMDWDVVDFTYGNGIKEKDKKDYFCSSTGYGWGIEVKSFSTSNKSDVRFKTPEKNGYNFEEGSAIKLKRRWSDLYVLALFKDTKKFEENITELKNWYFYVIPTYLIGSDSLTIEILRKKKIIEIPFIALKNVLDNTIIDHYEGLKAWKEESDSLKSEYKVPTKA